MQPSTSHQPTTTILYHSEEQSFTHVCLTLKGLEMGLHTHYSLVNSRSGCAAFWRGGHIRRGEFSGGVESERCLVGYLWQIQGSYWCFCKFHPFITNRLLCFTPDCVSKLCNLWELLTCLRQAAEGKSVEQTTPRGTELLSIAHHKHSVTSPQ